MTEAVEVRGTGRDPDRLRELLSTWFAGVLAPGSDPTVTVLSRPESNGMSSESVLFDLTATDPSSGERRTTPLVARLAPEADSVPVFPTYDLPLQYHVMRLVHEDTDVPVPTPRWLEADPAPLGTPFFVMSRLDGRVPPDVMPYNFDSWLKEAAPADRLHLVEATVAAIACIHTITPATHARLGEIVPVPEGSALRHHVAEARAYYEWAHDGAAIPVLDRGFAWLDANWPAEEGPTVLLWGDARIGNVLYDGFDPIGVLDWEMAAVGPPELDVAWGLFLHRFFEDLATSMDIPGMPDFLEVAEVVDLYEAASGHRPRDMRWHLTYAAVRHGIVMSRIHRRQVALGVAEMPADPDEMVLHRASIDAMVDGSYWATLPGGDPR